MSWDRVINIKTAEEVKLMREAGRINAEAIAAAVSIIQPGVTTADVNHAAEEVLKKYQTTSPFKNYPGPYPYPASICVSVNEELVHGIPGKRKLKEGDIVSIDSGAYYQGFVGDAAVTVGVGKISEQAKKLLDVTKQALEAGIAKMVVGNKTGDVSAAIQKVIESNHLFLTRVYTGHGVGREMHEGPQMPNYGTPGRGIPLKVGMTIALEPMVLIGTEETRVKADEWTVVSKDGSLTAHFEHTVAVTENGPLILTAL